MRILLTSLNQKHGFNPVVRRLFDPLGFTFIDKLEGEAQGYHLDAVFLSFIAPPCDFELDEKVMNWILPAHLPVIIFDHTETMPPNFRLGQSELPRESAYWTLGKTVQRMNVKAYFKRELLYSPTPVPGCPLFPLDWTQPRMKDFEGIDTPGSYNSRPIDILMSWGYSSISRPRLAGELLRRADKFNAHFCLEEADLERALEEKRERIFALLFCPWYRRIPIEHIMAWQQKAKISISLKGAGYKCFRQGEASYNSVMAQQDPTVVNWSFPWVGGENCISLPNAEDGEVNEVQAVDQLFEWLRVKQGGLYDIYTKGMINNRNYHMEAYSQQYLLPKILEALR